MEARAVLSEEDFLDLVKGKIVTQHVPTPRGWVEVKIILSDIGFGKMYNSITKASQSES